MKRRLLLVGVLAGVVLIGVAATAPAPWVGLVFGVALVVGCGTSLRDPA